MKTKRIKHHSRLHKLRISRGMKRHYAELAAKKTKRRRK